MAELREIGVILISQILVKCDGWFCRCDFSVWEAPASLKRCLEVILRVELKQSYFEILELVPAVFAKLSWNFNPSLSCCSGLVETDIISPVGRYLSWYDLFWWLVSEKIMIAFCLHCLAAFLDKIPLFHLGQTEHHLARDDGPLCAQHCALNSLFGEWNFDNLEMKLHHPVKRNAFTYI